MTLPRGAGLWCSGHGPPNINITRAPGATATPNSEPDFTAPLHLLSPQPVRLGASAFCEPAKETLGKQAKGLSALPAQEGRSFGILPLGQDRLCGGCPETFSLTEAR